MRIVVHSWSCMAKSSMRRRFNSRRRLCLRKHEKRIRATKRVTKDASARRMVARVFHEAVSELADG